MFIPAFHEHEHAQLSELELWDRRPHVYSTVFTEKLMVHSDHHRWSEVFDSVHDGPTPALWLCLFLWALFRCSCAALFFHRGEAFSREVLPSSCTRSVWFSECCHELWPQSSNDVLKYVVVSPPQSTSVRSSECEQPDSKLHLLTHRSQSEPVLCGPELPQTSLNKAAWWCHRDNPTTYLMQHISWFP